MLKSEEFCYRQVDVELWWGMYICWYIIYIFIQIPHVSESFILKWFSGTIYDVKNVFFRDMLPYGSLKNRRFRGTCCHNFHCTEIRVCENVSWASPLIHSKRTSVYKNTRGAEEVWGQRGLLRARLAARASEGRKWRFKGSSSFASGYLYPETGGDIFLRNVDVYNTTRCSIPEDYILQSHHSVTLQSYVLYTPINQINEFYMRICFSIGIFNRVSKYEGTLT